VGCPRRWRREQAPGAAGRLTRGATRTNRVRVRDREELVTLQV